MPNVYFGGVKGTKLVLEEDPEMVVVRTRSRSPLRSGPVPRPEQDLLDGFEFVGEYPEASVEIYRRSRGAKYGAQDVRRELRKFPDVRFAGSVLVHPESRQPIIYTENIFVKFTNETSPEACEKVIRDFGLTVKEVASYAPNSYFVEAPEGTGQEIFAIAEKLLAREDVELCHPELVEPLRKRAIHPAQWHLKPTNVNGAAVNAHANVEAAHTVTRGEGTTIALIDDGFDLDHEEFASSGKVAAPHDFMAGDDDPRPGPQDKHGTACAGVACGDGAHGASGVAPKARLMPLRMPGQIGSQANAKAFAWAADHGADVISCSWGPADGRWFDPKDPAHRAKAPIADNIRLAIDYAVQKGRRGKGCLVFFAAGNGNESVDNDGYASYTNVLAVAACNDRSKRSVYSDFGAAVFCSFPSSDFGFPAESRPEPLTPGIWTTDRMGADGYNPGTTFGTAAGDPAGNYTNSFGGTSSACPGAAGVAALMLSMNPDLRWAQAKEILRQSCDRIDPAAGNYDANGHSPLYGYGRLNAEKAVLLARDSRVSNKIVVDRALTTPILDLQKLRVEMPVAETATIDDVTVAIDLEHTYIGDLLITLIPPAASSAAPVVLHNRAGGGTHNLTRQYDSASVPALAAYRGIAAHGTWAVEIEDKEAQDVGRMRSVRLELALQSGGGTPPAGAAKNVAGAAKAAKPKRKAKSA